MRALALLVLVVLEGCAASAGAVAGALVNTAVGATVSGVRRANGECYTPCNQGSACNHATGMCDPLPCGGRCNFDQQCESTYVGDQCVSLKPVPTP